jgi:isopentenyl-diphosphate delta-isomerase
MSIEYVVLLDDRGRPIGQAPKSGVHTSSTPLHLAFSCYGFDRSNRLLCTRRAESKLTFPGVWTNTCCGHPMPGERLEDAVRRRLRDELGVSAGNLVCALPEFRYRAEMNGIRENEVCPVFLCRITGELKLNPDEVAEARWVSWEDCVQKALSPGSELSPWSVRQIAALREGGIVERFLGQDWTRTMP